MTTTYMRSRSHSHTVHVVRTIHTARHGGLYSAAVMTWCGKAGAAGQQTTLYTSDVVCVACRRAMAYHDDETMMDAPS